MTPKDAIERLESMQRQIIHGKNTFGEIADVIRKLESEVASSVESDLWHEYLRSERHSGYEGTCPCYYCKGVRDDFSIWKAKRLGNVNEETGFRTGDAQPGSGAASGSAEYVRVRCVICGWEDGLRADLAAAGQMGIYCDQCDGAQACELRSAPADGGQRGAQRKESNDQ